MPWCFRTRLHSKARKWMRKQPRTRWGVKTSLAPFPELEKQADGLVAQFASIRSRDHDTYAAILGATGGPSDDLMRRWALWARKQGMTEAMTAFDKAISASFQTQLDSVDANSMRSQIAGLVMLWLCDTRLRGGVVDDSVQGGAAVALAGTAVARHCRGRRRSNAPHRGERKERNRRSRNLVQCLHWPHRGDRAARGHACGDAGAAAMELASARAKPPATAAAGTGGKHTTAMSQMSSAVQEISQTTQTAAVDARKAEESAHFGGQTVQNTVQTIGELLTANSRLRRGSRNWAVPATRSAESSM